MSIAGQVVVYWFRLPLMELRSRAIPVIRPLCSKGAALAETLSMEGRLLYPTINGRPGGPGCSNRRGGDQFKRIVAKYGADAVAFYVSGQCLTEDYYVANKLLKCFIGCANIVSNSRLCMQSAVAGFKPAFGSDTAPCRYQAPEPVFLN